MLPISDCSRSAGSLRFPSRSLDSDVIAHWALVSPASSASAIDSDAILSTVMVLQTQASPSPDHPAEVEQDELRRLSISSIRSPLIDRLASAFELNACDAELTIDHLIRSEQLGKHDHGLIRAHYLINSGKFGPYGHRSGPEPVELSSSRLHVDGSGFLGYPTMARWIKAGSRMARQSGVCVATSESVYPSGALCDWARQVTADGVAMIMVATSPARVAGPGGTSPVVGTNPLCIGFPADPIPFISDTATSAINHGQLLLARANGEELPPDSALDPEGRVTRDPDLVDPTKGLGALLSLGGSYKTFAMAMAFELLVATGGGPMGPRQTGQHGVFAIFLGPELANNAAGPASAWLTGLDQDRTRIPGWESHRAATSRIDLGVVDVRSETHGKLQELLETAL